MEGCAQLPYEVWERIFLRLPVNDLVRFRRISQLHRAVADDRVQWRRRLEGIGLASHHSWTALDCREAYLWAMGMPKLVWSTAIPIGSACQPYGNNQIAYLGRHHRVGPSFSGLLAGSFDDWKSSDPLPIQIPLPALPVAVRPEHLQILCDGQTSYALVCKPHTYVVALDGSDRLVDLGKAKAVGVDGRRGAIALCRSSEDRPELSYHVLERIFDKDWGCEARWEVPNTLLNGKWRLTLRVRSGRVELLIRDKVLRRHALGVVGENELQIELIPARARDRVVHVEGRRTARKGFPCLHMPGSQSSALTIRGQLRGFPATLRTVWRGKGYRASSWTANSRSISRSDQIPRLFVSHLTKESGRQRVAVEVWDLTCSSQGINLWEESRAERLAVVGNRSILGEFLASAFPWEIDLAVAACMDAGRNDLLIPLLRKNEFRLSRAAGLAARKGRLSCLQAILKMAPSDNLLPEEGHPALTSTPVGEALYESITALHLDVASYLLEEVRKGEEASWLTYAILKVLDKVPANLIDRHRKNVRAWVEGERLLSSRLGHWEGVWSLATKLGMAEELSSIDGEDTTCIEVLATQAAQFRQWECVCTLLAKGEVSRRVKKRVMEALLQRLTPQDEDQFALTLIETLLGPSFEPLNDCWQLASHVSWGRFLLCEGEAGLVRLRNVLSLQDGRQRPLRRPL